MSRPECTKIEPWYRESGQVGGTNIVIYDNGFFRSSRVNAIIHDTPANRNLAVHYYNQRKREYGPSFVPE